MANIYLRSTDGSDTDDGSTWALAKATSAGVAAIDAAGDTIYVSQSHAESVGTTVTWAYAGTPASPIKIIGTSDAAEPPTAVSTVPTISTTGNVILTITGSFYMRGLNYFIGTGTGAPNTVFQNGVMAFENCSFQTVATGAANVKFGEGSRTDVQQCHLKNCTFKFASTNAHIKLEGEFRWEGGSILSGTTTPARLIYALPRPGANAVIAGVDFSNLANTFSFFDNVTTTYAFNPIIKNCTLPSGWPSSTNGPFNATPSVIGVRAEMYNCFAGATKIRSWVMDYQGASRDNTTIYRTGGASDDGVPFSIRMASTADSEYPMLPLEAPTIRAYVNSTSSTTISLEIIHDSQGAGTGAALRNNEFGIKVVYPGGVVDTFKADILAAAADITSSSETWTSTGLTTPVKQKVSVTFTPTSKGDVLITPILFTPSKVVYICPKLGA